jgi:hypothetical protein
MVAKGTGGVPKLKTALRPQGDERTDAFLIEIKRCDQSVIGRADFGNHWAFTRHLELMRSCLMPLNLTVCN